MVKSVQRHVYRGESFESLYVAEEDPEGWFYLIGVVSLEYRQGLRPGDAFALHEGPFASRNEAIQAAHKFIDGYKSGAINIGGRLAPFDVEAPNPLQAGRRRLAKLLTMSPDTWERLDQIAERLGMTRSGAMEHLVWQAGIPRR